MKKARYYCVEVTCNTGRAKLCIGRCWLDPPSASDVIAALKSEADALDVRYGFDFSGLVAETLGRLGVPTSQDVRGDGDTPSCEFADADGAVKLSRADLFVPDDFPEPTPGR